MPRDIVGTLVKSSKVLGVITHVRKDYYLVDYIFIHKDNNAIIKGGTLELSQLCNDQNWKITTEEADRIRWAEALLEGNYYGFDP